MMGAVPGQSSATPRASRPTGAPEGGSTVPTTSSARSALPPALVLLAATCVLLTGAVALAGPAAAIEDPRRPTAEITHGPSCGPGVVRIAVTNGSQPRRVALVFDGAGEQASAELAPGAQTELVSADVDWGQTVDVSVAVADPAGTAAGDPIEFGTYTRPSAEDCAAIAPELEPAAAPAVPTTPDSSTGQQTPRPSSPSAAPRVPVEPVPPVGSAVGAAGDQADVGPVAPGGVVTVRATGFTPGEPVTVSIVGIDEPLTTVQAAPDGSVQTVVQIPRGATVGAATVQLVGGLSAATAGMDLQVAARSRPVPAPTTPVPTLAAGFALLASGGVLGLMAARRSRAHGSSLRH
jgi:hypothetical protein